LPAAGQVTETNIAQNFTYQLQDQNTLSIYRVQEVFPVQLKRVKKLPYHCKGQPISTPLSNFYIFWHTLNELYHFSGYSKQQWLELYSEKTSDFVNLDMIIFDNEQEEQLYLFEKLRELIYNLKDTHVFIMAHSVNLTAFGDDKLNNFSESISTQPDLVIPVDYQTSSENYQFQMHSIHKNLKLGYDESQNTAIVQLLSLSSWDKSGLFTERGHQLFLADMDKIEQYLSSKPLQKILIDLRQNDGGSVSYANLFASRFTQEAEVGSYIEPFSTKGKLAPLAFTSKGNSSIPPVPIDVLVSKRTASAAEHLALLLKENEKTTLIGEQTRGAYSPVVLKSLPNGWIIGVPPYRVFDNDKQPLTEGVGIVPDIEVKTSD